MSTGPLRELVALSNAWATYATWPLFCMFAVLALACLGLRATGLAGRVVARRDAEVRYGLAIGLALFAVALALRILLPDRVHYTFNDEYEYVDHARRMMTWGEYHLWSSPPAGVFLYALTFLFFGASSGAAFAATILVASLTPPVFYWTLRRMAVERPVAVSSALLLAFAPLHVKHAASASLEVVSLLFLLLAIGTFVELLREPGWLRALCFALSLFAALTTRVENLALVILLPIVAALWRAEARRPAAGHVALAVLALLLALAYLPSILDAPIRYDPWWKTRLPALHLLATNLGFWVGGDAPQRKLVLLVAAVGLVAALRTSPRATTFWFVFLLLYSIVFVVYGLNVGYVEEAHQPPPWGARGAGHDMFRFNVVLLPCATFLLANGVVTLLRGARALARGEGRFAATRSDVRLVALAVAAVGLVGLLVANDEYRSYHPLDFIASRYNRGFEIAEFRFLRDFFAGRAQGERCYVLPPSAGVALGEVEIRPLSALAEELRSARSEDPPPYVYVNGRQLAVPSLGASFEAVRQRYELAEVARRQDGADRFYLFAVTPRSAATARGQ